MNSTYKCLVSTGIALPVYAFLRIILGVSTEIPGVVCVPIAFVIPFILPSARLGMKELTDELVVFLLFGFTAVCGYAVGFLWCWVTIK